MEEDKRDKYSASLDTSLYFPYNFNCINIVKIYLVYDTKTGIIGVRQHFSHFIIKCWQAIASDFYNGDGICGMSAGRRIYGIYQKKVRRTEYHG